MASTDGPALVEAMQKLHLVDPANDFNIDDILFQQRPRKRVKQDAGDLKARLEKKYLTPSSAPWTPRPCLATASPPSPSTRPTSAASRTLLTRTSTAVRLTALPGQGSMPM
ncbi:hypothetical protein O1611_g3855 [Lasiodiplodia mahajangana]|uniref:Uncharacterized protein n=1 Tax=Lasiodiplodia mahajangana TaxID=1108764 RepID=A0ACC2JQQ1_9PEZI|nr:hypothetical protein O1611_g3855 [Lasiodiplodia mahajangana]